MRDLLVQLRIFSVMIPGLVWVGYFWERFTGVTFVFSKSSHQLGNNSAPAHLAFMLEAAGVATLIGVPLFYLAGLWLRQYPERNERP